MRGRVLPAGADNQVLRTAAPTEAVAQYALETDRGEPVAIRNAGIRTGAAEDIAAVVRGEEVPAERVCFRGTPRFATASPRLARIDERLFAARGERRPDTVEPDVFLLG
ncbi:hypothetical protein GCM10010358_48510 [Streptomyces minutiscleroticus]|uniref:Uncharacterized protein n=1 Tax=Streptomyces minutiscleroticus TaxID=68238 RepID=A0A918U459_9ACTN|nr:hypothetical protein GCM10010358_48510 [Streptomyces minutiscleroticus]